MLLKREQYGSPVHRSFSGATAVDTQSVVYVSPSFFFLSSKWTTCFRLPCLCFTLTGVAPRLCLKPSWSPVLLLCFLIGATQTSLPPITVHLLFQSLRSTMAVVFTHYLPYIDSVLTLSCSITLTFAGTPFV